VRQNKNPWIQSMIPKSGNRFSEKIMLKRTISRDGALSLASAADGGNSDGIARLERCHHR